MRGLPSLQPGQVPLLPWMVRQHVELVLLINQDVLSVWIQGLMQDLEVDKHFIRHLTASAIHLQRP